jgi:hypothetical protein
LNPPASLRQDFEKRIELIRGSLDAMTLERVIDHTAPQLLARMLVPPATQFENIFRLPSLDLNSMLQQPSGLLWHLQKSFGRVCVTFCGGAMLEASDAAESALLDTLQKTGPFQVSEMHASLGNEAKVALASKLVQLGVLRFVEHGK